MDGRDWPGMQSKRKRQLKRPRFLMKSIRCVFCSLSAYSGGRSSSFNMSACVHSWIEQRSLSLSSLNKFFFEHTQTCVPDKLDLSLCTVGTSSAFLQTADNICLLTCTVTCRTLLTLQMILPPNPTRPAVLWTVPSHQAPSNSGAQTRSLHLRLPEVDAS